MKKIFIFILIIIITIAIFFYFFKNNNNSETPSNISRTSYEENSTQNTTSNNESKNPVIHEEEISAFSTKIYTKDSGRQNNVGITCSTLNETIVKANETFSFTQTIGPSTSDKGYKEADIFTSNGKKKKGLGGGNCQVSSTLYNAVLTAPGLAVVERHEHSNKVPYVSKGKDAAVSYGSVDFKFRNDNPFDIKIYCSTDEDNVYVSICKLQ